MKYEYKLHHDIRSKQNSVQWMSHMMIGIVKGMEIVNDNYNPFDVKLDGLSDKIGSDMHNYYAVLGDIYEKYNQPGKQMAPELRLLLMISGAALSMQVNKVIPGMGGMSNTVKSEENLTDLRQKAEADTNKHPNDYVKKQHDAAAQKAADIKMIQEKELEMKRTTKLLDTKNTNNIRKFKENLILSSEAPPSRDYRGKNSNKHQEENEDEDEEENDYDRTHKLSQAEIEHVRKMKYMDEQKSLEMLRQTAYAKSEMFRNNMMRNDMDDRKKRDLTRQSQQLDDIIGNVNSDRLKPKSKSKSLAKPKINKSLVRSSINRSSDTRSTESSASTVSINPKVKDIMKRTADKAIQENQRKYTDFSDEPPSTKVTQSAVKPTTKPAAKPMMKLVNNAPVQNNKSSNASNTKAKSNKLNLDIKFDEKIEMLLENNGSDYDDISREDISIGSRGSNGKKGKNTKINKSSDLLSSSRSSNRGTMDMLDFGAMSIGSKTKGTKMTITSGKK